MTLFERETAATKIALLKITLEILLNNLVDYRTPVQLALLQNTLLRLGDAADYILNLSTHESETDQDTDGSTP